jgi:FixJ family two-component response regulator
MDHHRAAWKIVGVAEFLTKPIHPESLFNALGAAIETSRAARAA